MTKQRRKFHHRLVLVDRGDVHRHRWKPTCACGWIGVPAMTAWAEQQYRDHVDATQSAFRSGQRGQRPRWRRPTPECDLPESLRAGRSAPNL